MERTTVFVTFQPEEPLPRTGDTIEIHGFQTYRARVKQVLDVEDLPTEEKRVKMLVEREAIRE